MITVYKYPLELTEKQTVELPEGAEILTVAEQRGTICLWARVDTEERKRPRTIYAFGTGWPCNDADFIGTVFLDGGNLVWHFFEG